MVAEDIPQPSTQAKIYNEFRDLGIKRVSIGLVGGMSDGGGYRWAWRARMVFTYVNTCVILSYES